MILNDLLEIDEFADIFINWVDKKNLMFEFLIPTIIDEMSKFRK